MLFSACTKKEKVISDKEIEWLKNNDSISIALFPYYPPYQFINDNNTIEGIFIEYFDLIEDKIGHEFNKKYYSDWPELIDDVKNKKTDMILEAQSTQGRIEYLNFYPGLFDTPFVIVASKDTPIGVSLDDFDKKTVTVPTGYAAEEYLREKHPKIKLQTYIDEITSLQKVQDGIHDAYFGPKTIANYLIKTKGFNNLKVVTETNYFYNPGIAINNENDELNRIVQKAIHSISDQEKETIIKNWLYTETRPFYTRTSFLIPLSIAILAAFLISLSVNFYLSHIVKIKTKALRIAKNIAEKDNQLKTAFIYNISHEIRAPMNGIIGFSKLLKEAITSSEKNKYTQFIVHSCKRLISTMDDILEISKLQTNQVELTPQKTDMYHVFETVFSVFEKAAKKKDISLILNNNLLEDQRHIYIDTSKLIKVISGLLENAIKYTKRGAVLVSSHVQKNTLIINVRDSGIGIDQKNQQLIFKSFSQSENQILRKYGGPGFGLTIAKEYTNLMGGQLSFSSIPNKGSTFRIELPFYPMTLIEKPEHTTFESPIDSKTDSYIILIAEDGDVNFLVLKTILSKIEQYHFTIHRAKNGKEAVDFCTNNDHIDLVFMDIKMPEMDGYKATQHIKKLYPNLPVIAQTAYTTNEDIQYIYAAGCDDFMSKPIDPNILRKIIDKYLPVYSL